jgi:hypothetical protein
MSISLVAVWLFKEKRLFENPVVDIPCTIEQYWPRIL